MKNKGFTLVELIAVIVIMGMILLIVFPATSRLMRDNEEREYDTYYDLVGKGIELYARTRRDDIGGITGTGCVDDQTLSNLINSEYVKKYEGKEGVECRTPNEYSQDELALLGVDISKEYVNIRIENKKGKISIQYSMICKKANKNKPEYVNLVEKRGNCSRYIAEVSNSLVKTISGGTIPATLDTDNTYYINGSATNNYLWYSGKMWSIISYNTVEKTVKLVTDENMSLVTYNTMTSNNFKNSNIDLWLNNVFYKTLRNPEKYVLDSEWNYTGVASGETTTTPRTNTSIGKVGLLTHYEYKKINGGFLNIGENFWLLSGLKNDNNKVWYVNSSNTLANTAANTYFGVRPTIVLRSNLTFIPGGNGTVNNPYRLTGDTVGNSGVNLNTRYVGEYVSINNVLFRISDIKNGQTKLISDEPLNVEDKKFHYFDKKYSNNTYIGAYLTEEWSQPIDDVLSEGDFCTMVMTNTTSQTIDCPTAEVISLKIGIPKVGDMFTNGSNKEYWTLSNATEDTLNVVEPDGTLRSKAIEETSGVRAVIYLKDNITILSGSGTKLSPYTIV
jgi:prepilin-type N-terminal cleavage/methylation domain-containing protein